MKTESGYHTSKPKVTLADLRAHRHSYPERCDWPVYRPTGAMLTAFTDCERWAEWPVKDPRVMSGGTPGSSHRPHPSYCTQHWKMCERLLQLDTERKSEVT